MKTVAEKARVKAGSTIAVINPVPDVVDMLGLPDDVRFVQAAEAQLVLVFVQTRAELEDLMPASVRDLAPGAALWVLFRKRSGAAQSDMSRNDIWTLAERMYMRPLGLISVDDVWSVFRLRRSQ